MTIEASEDVVLERLVPDLESQGYDVFVHPNKKMVPDFLGAYQPDVIALGKDKNLAIEIKQTNRRSERLLQDLARRFEGQSRWELRIVWVNPSEAQSRLEPQSNETISSRLKEVSGLLDAGFTEAAMLMSWAAFEAIGRKLMTKEFVRPQSPGRLVQVLATEGHITPDEGDALRQLGDVRNRVIHGELTAAVTHKQVEAFLKVLTTLVQRLKQ